MRILIAGMALLTAFGSEAAEIIRCTSKSAPEVTMSLESRRMLNRTVSCISGRFISDMTPCATNGGFGLSYPTGSASLSRIVRRWQDYGDHFGGVVSHAATPETIHFSGGFMGSDGFQKHWSFTADRIDGTGKLIVEKGQDGEGTFDYVCSRVRQRF